MMRQYETVPKEPQVPMEARMATGLSFPAQTTFPLPIASKQVTKSTPNFGHVIQRAFQSNEEALAASAARAPAAAAAAETEVAVETEPESDEEEAWVEVSSRRKKKNKLPLVSRKNAFGILDKALINYCKENKVGNATVCAMADRYGRVLCYGISNWKATLGDEAPRDHEIAHSISGATERFNPKGKKFGTNCAEVHCLWQIRNGYAMHDTNPAYSLAWDNASGKYKCGCGNCAKMLAANEIDDLFYRRKR